jgi:pimeloyl-ACP methyl ester carboxylesterase
MSWPARLQRIITWPVFPGSLLRVDRADVERGLLPGEELTLTRTDRGEDVAVVHRPPPSGGHWVVFLYGNAMTLRDTADIRARLAAAGHGVLCPDYLGYGLSGGTADEAGCYRSADAALSYLDGRFGAGAADVTVVGWSLGSAVALDVAARTPLRRLVLLSPLTGVSTAVLSRLRLRGLPEVGPFGMAGKAARVGCPTLLVVGAADRLTPAPMARVLAARLGDRATLEVVPGTGHSDLLDRQPVWDLVLDFIRVSRDPE